MVALVVAPRCFCRRRAKPLNTQAWGCARVCPRPFRLAGLVVTERAQRQAARVHPGSRSPVGALPAGLVVAGSNPAPSQALSKAYTGVRGGTVDLF